MTAHTDSYIKNKIAAAWAGLMIGDALGAPAEFCYHEDIMAKYPAGLQDMVPGFCICTDRQAGVVTDDTQMAYCLHMALLDANGWNRETALKRYSEWLATDPPDIGEATYDALTGNPNPESQGNGALMRVLPIALWAATHPDFDWQTAAREDAAITHPHPICGEANMVFVHALLTAMQPDVPAEEIFFSTLEFADAQHLSAELRQTLLAATSRPDYDGEYIGWVRVALQGAFYQLLRATSFRKTMVDVVSAGGDTDTNAAITGALLGAWKGIDCLERSWLAAVRAANPRHYTKLLPTLRALPRYPIRMDEPEIHYTHRTAGIILPID
ncbi:MAG: ADP-ribosylglycohydrolase family protein [Akkermansia sp.]|nr:ADP-ribosylglycohydrolase family protein [Akkermansia sp.]